MTKIGNEYKTFDNQAKADIAIAKDAFEKSDKNYQVVGGTVFRRDAQGNVTATPKVKYDYQLATATMTKQKNAGDIEGWLKTAQSQLDSINKQLQDPSIDPLDAIALQNDAEALQKAAAKYVGYGGFTKGKSGGKGSKFDYASRLASTNKTGMATTTALRALVKKSTIKRKAVPSK